MDSAGGADRKGEVETTDEDFEGYRVIKAMSAARRPAARVIGRDSKVCSAVHLDDNNRKPAGRLWFSRSKKHLGVFGENEFETGCRSTTRRTSTVTPIIRESPTLPISPKAE